jgi:hypothetical protein
MPFPRKPPLSIPLILEWIDAHKARTGAWPKKMSYPVKAGYLGDNWKRIDHALKLGLRGLDGGSSLARLLVEARGVRIKDYAPDLNEEQLLGWADRHHEQTGAWPTEQSGAVLGQPGEDWHNVEAALRLGLRGLPGWSSLAKLIAVGPVRPKPGLPIGPPRSPRLLAQFAQCADR